MKYSKDKEDKDIQNIKDILEKEHGREFTWNEATEGLGSIKILAKIICKMAMEDSRRKELLKENPKGCHLNSGGICEVCYDHYSGENTWYDKHGLKCTNCQKAINDKIIPLSLIKNKELWYSKTELKIYFNFERSDINKYIKKSILKERIIPGEGKKVHLQLFLIQDNKSFLPPKKLLKGKIVKEIYKGEECYIYRNWYEFVDHKLAKRLAKYKICECLAETFTKPIEMGQIITKNINPIFSIKQ